MDEQMCSNMLKMVVGVCESGSSHTYDNQGIHIHVNFRRIKQMAEKKDD